MNDLYRLDIEGRKLPKDTFTEAELKPMLKALPYDVAKTARVWGKGMDDYSPIWNVFEWAECYAPAPDASAEESLDATWCILEGKWNDYKLPSIRIPMVGASGVGKTSLLVSMYAQLSGAFLPDSDADGGRTDQIIDTKRLELTKLAKGEKGRMVTETACEHTKARQDFHFKTSASTGGEHYTQPFCFVDFAGGWFNGVRSNPEVIDVLSKAPVSMLVVDAPALMEDADVHEQINRPGRIHDLYKLVVDRWRHSARSVVVVLLKAELYIHQHRENEMNEMLRKRYKGLFELLYSHNVKIYVTPVATVGGVEFDHFDGDGVQWFRYSGGGYTPAGCEIPLKICINRALYSRINTLTRRLEAKERWMRILEELVLRRKQRQSLEVLTSFIKDSSLTDVDIKRYRLYAYPRQNS